MDKTTSCRKVGAFCRLFFAKEQRKALKERLDFFTVRQIGAARDVSTTSFYGHMFDSDMEQGTDSYTSSGSQCFTEATIPA